jgi:hypothetical protein
MHVIDALSDLFILRGIPGHIRSDNGPEFVAMAVREWIAAVGAKTAYIKRDSPWENGRTATVKASTRSSVTNCSTVNVLFTRLPTTGNGGLNARASGSTIRPSRSARARTAPNRKLTSQPDHSIGAG